MKIMTEKQWYGSKEHFNTEMSYEQYKNKIMKYRLPEKEHERLKQITKKEIDETKKAIEALFKSIKRELNKKYTDMGYILEKLETISNYSRSICRAKANYKYEI